MLRASCAQLPWPEVEMLRGTFLPSLLPCLKAESATRLVKDRLLCARSATEPRGELYVGVSMLGSLSAKDSPVLRGWTGPWGGPSARRCS